MAVSQLPHPFDCSETRSHHRFPGPLIVTIFPPPAGFPRAVGTGAGWVVDVSVAWAPRDPSFSVSGVVLFLCNNLHRLPRGVSLLSGCTYLRV